MEIPEGLKTLRWADDIALLKAEFKDEIAVKRLNRLGMLIEALKAENEELKAKLDKAKDALEAVNEKSLYVPAIVQEALLEIRGKND